MNPMPFATYLDHAARRFPERAAALDGLRTLGPGVVVGVSWLRGIWAPPEPPLRTLFLVERPVLAEALAAQGVPRGVIFTLAEVGDLLGVSSLEDAAKVLGSPAPAEPRMNLL